MSIYFVKKVIDDVDGTVGWFQVNNDTIVQNHEGNPDLALVHKWLSDNNEEIPDFSSFLVGG